MKKILIAVLTLVLSLSMLFGASAEAADISGEWFASFLGMTMSMTLNDGAYVVSFDGEPTEGTYSFDGTTLYMDEGSEEELQMPYDAEKNIFVMDLGDGMILEFGREAIAAFTPAAGRTDSAIEEFAGEWIATQISAFGIIAPPEMMDLNLYVKVEGNTVIMSIDIMGDVEEVALDGVLADGILTISVPASESTDEMAYVMQLLEDGTASASFEMFGEAITFYMVKVA